MNVEAANELAPTPDLGPKYRLGERLGQGGMGLVHAAEVVETGATVAVKLLHAKLGDDANARARFLREARRASSIASPHSTRVLDVGTTADGVPFMVMEHLEGETVDARLRREGPFDASDAASILVQVLDVLSEAHAKGIVHRDLKPANVFLQRAEDAVRVKVLDFGIAVRAKGSAEATADSMKLTEPNTLLGSPHYMSPEQLRGAKSVDARSDIWACGVLLYEMLTARTPFAADTVGELFGRIATGDPAPLVVRGAKPVPTAITKLVERCLRKDADARPQTAADLASALAPFADADAQALAARIRERLPSLGASPGAGRGRASAVGGLSLVVLAGAVAYVAASKTPTSPITPAKASEHVAMLEPAPVVVPAATATATATAPAVNAAPQASANDPAGARGPAASAPPPVRAPSPARSSQPAPSASGRVRQLSDIELIP